LTAIAIRIQMNTMEDKLQAFKRLLEIMDELREECPWDKKQTMHSLRHLTIEEVYELTDAIIENDQEEIKKEIGDILLHMVFYARIASESAYYDIADVINRLCDKLIHRHPHIYGDPDNNGRLTEVADDAEVSRNWEKLKLKEGTKSVLQGVPVSLPSLIKSMRIQEKARAAGFDWEKKEQVWEKVEEEMNEFRKETEQGNHEESEHEFGDLLFSLINYARFMNINPEEALEKTNRKFIRRFQYLEQSAMNAGRKLGDMTLSEMDVYWNEAKAMGL
jgi:XTP/dITP diphosphohydrolase